MPELDDERGSLVSSELTRLGLGAWAPGDIIAGLNIAARFAFAVVPWVGSSARGFSASCFEGVSSNRDELVDAAAAGAAVEAEGVVAGARVSECWGVEGVCLGGLAPGIIIAGLNAC